MRAAIFGSLVSADQDVDAIGERRMKISRRKGSVNLKLLAISSASGRPETTLHRIAATVTDAQDYTLEAPSPGRLSRE
ncbi:MAG: hypothetical protein IPN78_06830 [Candidatus Accumulibacter sp.]|nr:hypothetical protein [Candidatus Accumulibacter propinquus]